MTLSKEVTVECDGDFDLCGHSIYAGEHDTDDQARAAVEGDGWGYTDGRDLCPHHFEQVPR